MKPGHKITIRKIVNLTNGSSIPYKGTFLEGFTDSIRISLNTANDKQQLFLNDIVPFPRIEDYKTTTLSIALSDVSYIDYSGLTEKTENIIYNVVFCSILGSLAALTLTPLFCIDFNDKKFNGDRYKKWAIGGAIGMASSFTILIPAIKIDDNKYHFKLDLPDKDVKVWNFKYE